MGDSAFNPSLPAELNDAEAVGIKGDSIGDTLYSERFVLSTLLKLTKLDDRPLREDEQFETDLCSLWDMTIETDVIKLLLKHSVLEIFSTCIQNSNDPRLVEILIGTSANMCVLPETREYLCAHPDITFPILENIACFDSLTLIQLMRFLQSVLVFENSGDESLWFHHLEQVPEFVDKFSFILSNSCNPNLLVGAFEAINAICTKFSVLDIQPDEEEAETAKDFKEVFVKTSLVASINDAFKQLLYPDPINPTDDGDSTAEEEHDGDAEEMVSKKKGRIMNLFLDILVILAGFEASSIEAFVDCLPEILENVARVLATLCSPINLLPLTTHEQGIVENINELFQALQDPFHEQCFANIVRIYSLIEDDCRATKGASASGTGSSDWDERVGAEEEVNAKEMQTTLFELIARISVGTSQDQLEGALRITGPIACQSVLNREQEEHLDGEVEVCLEKFRKALKNLWNIQRENGDVQL